jgi:hypothetical protein
MTLQNRIVSRTGGVEVYSAELDLQRRAENIYIEPETAQDDKIGLP